jgi:hypothetical protein
MWKQVYIPKWRASSRMDNASSRLPIASIDFVTQILCIIKVGHGYDLTWTCMKHWLRQLTFNGMWLRVDLKTNTNKDICVKEIGLHAQNTLTILGSISNVIGGTYIIWNTHPLGEEMGPQACHTAKTKTRFDFNATKHIKKPSAAQSRELYSVPNGTKHNHQA